MNNELYHHGVKGMKWGVRTDREAKKDAEEFARAKMFYGKGAGNRRKLIKAKVESQKKKDKDYAAAFEYHLSLQDMGKHAAEAQKERRTKDLAEGTVKTGRKAFRVANSGVGRMVIGSLLR